MAEDLDKKIKYLKDRITSRLPKIAEIISSDRFRDQLDVRPTILDIGYSSIRANISAKRLSKTEEENFPILYKTFLEVVRQAGLGKTVRSLDDARFLELFNSKKSVGAILVDSGEAIPKPGEIFVISKNFKTMREFVSRYISNNPALIGTRLGAKKVVRQNKNSFGSTTTYISKLDLGHLATENVSALDSPLELKILAVLEEGNRLGSELVKAKASRALKELYDIQGNISYDFKNVTPESIATAQRVLASGYVVLSLQTRKRNQQFAGLEAGVYSRLVAELALICSSPQELRGSNTVVQDIDALLVNAITKKKTLPVKKHTKQKGTVKIPIKPINVAASGYTGRALPRSREPLVNLEAILRARINEQVTNNMGTGQSRNILNYRTGRLAESVGIAKLSESRAGMISVFYNYMKNPYSTFSEGGQQQYPRSRAPKALISKSIREIAAPIVGNRLRSILV